jgi:hypothetical protein
MSAPTDPADQRKSDFMAAEEIKRILSGRDKAEQERIIRWAKESVGLSVATNEGVQLPPQMPTLAGAPGQVSQQPPSPRAKDIKTFVDEKKPKNDVQFAAVVAYFHQFEAPEGQRKEAINPSDLQEGARLSGRDRFRKPVVPLNNAATLGYLDRAGGGLFRINAVGENLVAMSLPGIERKGKGKKPPKMRIPKKRNSNSKAK